jgi:hypothetical protein
MIPKEEWLDPEEWRELGESEAHVYKQLAGSCGLNMNSRRDGRILDFLYKTHVDFVWQLPIAILKKALPSRLHVRNVEAAQQANRQRGIETLHAIKRAWHELWCPHRLKPTTKEVARHASILLGKAKTPLSPRHTSRLVLQLRASGDIS